ncbi:MAG: hypothetical protein KGH98_01790 [Candidatus Micrarchaeota archaeon]|nr:hypothetical protein [Candidatus Micrarchaeota archaeon]
MPARARLRGSDHRFFLIRPSAGSDIGKMAERLMGFECVQEVYVTDGEFGYLVKARPNADGKADKAEDYIRRRLDKRFGTVTCHYQCRKR